MVDDPTYYPNSDIEVGSGRVGPGPDPVVDPTPLPPAVPVSTVSLSTADRIKLFASEYRYPLIAALLVILVLVAVYA